MDGRDYRGYYKILGVSPKSTQSEIKTAYRKKALEFHPDRNSAAGATEQFQLIQTAYETLSDEDARRRYDADSIVRQSVKDDEARSEDPIAPIRCQFCGAVSAQPRYNAFYFVVSFIFNCYRSAIHGIFCAKCEAKRAALATGLSLLLGWWSISGFFYTVHALISNLFSRNFATHNFRIRTHQILYFASVGELRLAAANAELLSNKLEIFHFENPKEMIDEEVNHLLGLLKRVSALYRSQGGDKVAVRDTDTTFGRTFVYQFSLVIIGASILVLSPSCSDRGYSRGVTMSDGTRVEALELPPTSLFEVYDPELSTDVLAPFKVTNASQQHLFVKLYSAKKHQDVMSFFIRGNETLHFDVPLGSYEMKYAVGSNWYGEKYVFGRTTRYYKIPEVLKFDRTRSRIRGHDLVLMMSTREDGDVGLKIQPTEF